MALGDKGKEILGAVIQPTIAYPGPKKRQSQAIPGQQMLSRSTWAMNLWGTSLGQRGPLGTPSPPYSHYCILSQCRSSHNSLHMHNFQVLVYMLHIYHTYQANVINPWYRSPGIGLEKRGSWVSAWVKQTAGCPSAKASCSSVLSLSGWHTWSWASTALTGGWGRRLLP